jgi:hypothetical protein
MSKSRSKRNALRHGVYSREPMLPGEKIGDYETLQAELNEEWAPEGASERAWLAGLLHCIGGGSASNVTSTCVCNNG